MSKPLGYWGCNYEYQLITDVMETYGDNLQHMEESDQSWLIGRCADYCRIMSEGDEEPSPHAEELSNRLHELSTAQLGALIQGIVNVTMTKPLTYWGCNYELPLIDDCLETWGQGLEYMSALDRNWLLGRLGSYYWMQHCSGAPSDAAQELVDRIEQEEIPVNQVSALVSALANK